MSNFEVIIGVEIHIELNTKTKMFSPAPNRFNDEPNTNVHPIDLAYPGTLPLVNKQAIVKAIKLAKALKMEIDPLVRFDRKNYFYPDLPKGYQITQQFHPIAQNGSLLINVNGQEKNIEIERFHLEEDTAKQTITDTKILHDFNRSGVPLIEIVTKPIIRSADEAIAYIDTIRKIALALDISEARMDRGGLRADINISLRPYGYQGYGNRVEIKNLNSLSNVKKAIDLEIQNQTKTYLENKTVDQVTKRFDESKQEVITMRAKSDAIDYRYFRDPNIPTIKISQSTIDNIKINELPWEKQARYEQEKLNQIQITALVNDLKLATYFDNIKYTERDKLANLFFSEVVSLANKTQKHVVDLGIKITVFEDLLKRLNNEEISAKHFKAIVPLLVNNTDNLDEIIKSNNYFLIKDEQILESYLLELMQENEKVVNEYLEKPEKVNKLLLGLLMKKTSTQAHPIISNKILEKLLRLKFGK
ncbi:Asp-tRNA(Asn)/Glu-tRNA(Gln) amidotransferase subunit GatB [Mycoplasmopsis agassizii]|uniref:Aspartyl/glutamyl-tRNA(Asn/Gln) amidotransferase subunit B n=1 Tax=Mycoplasmopsis agassizii TaxID=33922 RepID=A0ABX4H6F4_9BACT|nr:Asp-tRNA(Asn)/Glu-tRNA(Gln) amidotransferase subunit GatB [Mycoplasmopsis agassizii]PAF55495.1 Asp-tRNA(Asn)/Glu-tRNA(Gln) amidotransferase GatCAB subunit B [Mycoplasmopsis agassizii]SMC18076.1 aspartyl/glutamyl-tRNA(Asn/Gln) amidotransferase subunit B [Mycoplasmopsis agassizii]